MSSLPSKEARTKTKERKAKVKVREHREDKAKRQGKKVSLRASADYRQHTSPLGYGCQDAAAAPSAA